jgi:hypothetical protein
MSQFFKMRHGRRKFPLIKRIKVKIYFVICSVVCETTQDSTAKKRTPSLTGQGTRHFSYIAHPGLNKTTCISEFVPYLFHGIFSLSIIEDDRLIQFSVTITVDCSNHTKRINTMCERNARVSERKGRKHFAHLSQHVPLH